MAQVNNVTTDGILEVQEEIKIRHMNAIVRIQNCFRSFTNNQLLIISLVGHSSLGSLPGITGIHGMKNPKIPGIESNNQFIWLS